jgi:GNAT superfamily N-acetyltransferase
MIRPATIDDVPRLVELGAQMHAESRYRVLAFAEDKVTELYTDLIEHPDALIMVSERAGIIIGMIVARIHAPYFSRDLASGDLHLYIQPAHRGGLSGPRLIAAYMHWAKARGAKMIDLGNSARICDTALARLYEYMGFEPVGTLYQLGDN